MKKKALALLLCTAVVLSLCACGGSGGDSASEATTAQSEYYFKDGVLVSEDVRIEITDYKVIPVGQPGNEYGEKPVIAFWYEVTNLTGNENVSASLAWIVVFTAYQDTDPNLVNELNVGMLPDDAFLDTQDETIKKDGTVPCAIAYELDSDTIPVVLKATRGIGGESLGEQTFSLDTTEANIDAESLSVDKLCRIIIGAKSEYGKVDQFTQIVRENDILYIGTVYAVENDKTDVKLGSVLISDASELYFESIGLSHFIQRTV